MCSTGAPQETVLSPHLFTCTPQTFSTILGHGTFRNPLTVLQWVDVLVMGSRKTSEHYSGCLCGVVWEQSFASVCEKDQGGVPWKKMATQTCMHCTWVSTWTTGWNERPTQRLGMSRLYLLMESMCAPNDGNSMLLCYGKHSELRSLLGESLRLRDCL